MGFGIKSVSSSSFLANTPCAGINAKAASFVVVVVVVVVVLVLPPLSAFIIFVRISEVKAERCRAALHESVVLVAMEVVVALDDDDDDDVEGAGEDSDEAQLKNRAEARSDDGACASVIIL